MTVHFNLQLLMQQDNIAFVAFSGVMGGKPPFFLVSSLQHSYYRNKFKIYKKAVLHLWRMGLTGDVWYQLCCTMIFESRLYRSALMRHTSEVSGSGWSFERWHSELCYQLLSLGIEQHPGEVLNELIEEAEEEQMKTEYLLEREVDLVLSALTDTNRLVMRTALVTGLRVGDVLALKPDRLKSHFWVTEQKTGKKRQVGLPEPLLSDLKKNAGKYWVFPGRDPKKHHTRQAVWKDVKRAAKAFRLPQNVAPTVPGRFMPWI